MGGVGLPMGGGEEAPDPLLHQLPLTGSRAAIGAPAAGGIDGEHSSLHHGAAPVGEILHLTAGQLAGEGAAPEGNGMESLAVAVHISTACGLINEASIPRTPRVRRAVKRRLHSLVDHPL
jgi:hypothetical protein